MHYSQGFFLGLNDFSSSFGVRDYCKSLSLGAVCREDVFAKMYMSDVGALLRRVGLMTGYSDDVEYGDEDVVVHAVAIAFGFIV